MGDTQKKIVIGHLYPDLLDLYGDRRRASDSSVYGDPADLPDHRIFAYDIYYDAQ